jgi:hypothetical protein
MKMTDTTIHIIKYDIRNIPGFDAILMKAIIPVTTTMMVNIKEILRDNLVIFSFNCRSIYEIPFLEECSLVLTSYV